MTPTEHGEAARWIKARDAYIELGLHPDVAGELAHAWMDGDPPESLTEAYARLSEQRQAPAARARPIARREGES